MRVERRDAVEALRELLAERGVPMRRVELAGACVDLLLRRAVTRHEDGSAYVITGDIPAMWLRDSAWQVRPLLALAREVPSVVELVAGVLRTQVEQVLIDPRANAFNDGPTGAAMRRDFRDQSPWVYERKYAVDSLCASLTLAWLIWRTTGSLEHVDDRFRAAADAIVSLWRAEQEHEPGSYRFQRRLGRRQGRLSRRGFGTPVARTGMTWSAFRPSDDACVYGYHVPANALAAVSLERLDALVGHDEARSLAAEIRSGIARQAVVDGIYAYEVDGLGNHLLQDDANVPSLLALPYLGFCGPDDPIYAATRAWALTPANPCWVDGARIHGMGSTHTRSGFVWPLAIAFVLASVGLSV